MIRLPPLCRVFRFALLLSLLNLWEAAARPASPCPIRLLYVPSDDEFDSRPGTAGAGGAGAGGADAAAEAGGAGAAADAAAGAGGAAAAAAAGADAGRALALSESGLSYLSSLPSPIYVVPALGVYRGGKSLLLNRVMGLSAPYAPGFGVGHSQSTHTRGVDVCAELVDGLGTVVWMDTEGLWSSQYSRGRYGAKIFSLALLFASAVLLNSVKVLSDQFFDFFGEQQQVARMLKAGLAEQGIPRDALLPDGLSLFWVLQQPIAYNGTDAAVAVAAELDAVATVDADVDVDADADADADADPGETAHRDPPSSASTPAPTHMAEALRAFLHRPGDELRDRIRRDFAHRMHEVPLASHDARRWEALDSAPDEELLPEYVQSGRRLREAILRDLARSRPLVNSTVASQMRLYLDLVQTGRYSSTLAKEVFEETEMGNICDEFHRVVCNWTGSLPVPAVALGKAFIEARRMAEPRADLAADTYHLDTGWKERLRQCLGEREMSLRRLNGERAMDKFRAEAGAASEDASGCYFLDELSARLSTYVSTYREDFGPAAQEKAADYAQLLQRARLLDCVRLRDVLVPLAPLLLWLFCWAYLREGTPSALGTMFLHGFIVLGSYSFLQMTNQLPPYLDLDFPFFKSNKDLLDLVVQLPPNIPWATLAHLAWTVNCVFAAWKIATYLARMFRPAGAGREVHQMINLELKVNSLRKFADAMMRQKIIEGALDASTCIDHGDARGAYRSLLKGLNFACELGDDELARFGVSAGFAKVAMKLIRDTFMLPPKECAVGDKIRVHRLDEFEIRRDMQKLLAEMIHVMQLLSKAKY